MVVSLRVLLFFCAISSVCAAAGAQPIADPQSVRVVKQLTAAPVPAPVPDLPNIQIVKQLTRIADHETAAKDLVTRFQPYASPLIALVALAVAIFSLLTSRRVATVTAWNTAHARLGTLFDMAINDVELNEVINEEEDDLATHALADQEKAESRRILRSPKQIRWAANVLLALEQATVASTAMNCKTKRVWRRFVKQFARKPTFRAVFLNAEMTGPALAESEWRSDLRSVELALEGLGIISDRPWRRCVPRKRGRFTTTLTNTAQKLAFLENNFGLSGRSVANPDEGLKPANVDGFRLIPVRFTKDNSSYESALRELYQRAGQNMLPLSDSWSEIVSGHRYGIVRDGQLVGQFSVGPCFGGASIGVLIHPEQQHKGLGTVAFAWAAEVAQALGYDFVYADIYDDNAAAIEAIQKAGLRRFSWYGERLTTVRETLRANGG